MSNVVYLRQSRPSAETVLGLAVYHAGFATWRSADEAWFEEDCFWWQENTSHLPVNSSVTMFLPPNQWDIA